MTTRARRYKLDDEVWPFGQPVIACPFCRGTGHDAEEIQRYIVSHIPGDRLDLRDLRCKRCKGRKLILVADAAGAPMGRDR